MRSVHLLVVLAIGVVGVAWLVFSSGTGRPKPEVVADPLADLVIGEPIAWENLAIFPVSAKTPRQLDRFITLDEGLQAGTIEILERGAAPGQGSASQEDPFAAPAAVVPPGADPFALSETEQRGNNPTAPPAANDRAIAEEVVIAPGIEPTAIQVYCVEWGRWGRRGAADYASILSSAGGQGSRFASVDLASSTADAGYGGYAGNLSLVAEESRLAEQANTGKFIGSIGSLNKPARLAVQAGEGQRKVWDEVASQNVKAEVEAATGTFTANYSDAESLERLAPYLKRLQEPIGEAPNIVGVVVAVNGKIESMDVFESTPLFQKLWPKLLKSYALDAASAEPVEGDAKPVSADDATAFLRKIATAKSKSKSNREESQGGLAVFHSESDGAFLFTAHERKTQVAPAAVIGGMGGGGLMGDAVHSAGYSK